MVITTRMTRGQAAQATQQVGERASAHREDGGQGQQNPAAVDGAAKGRLQGIEEGTDRLRELVVIAVEFAAGGPAFWA